ncbi:MAG: dihydrodipicolinate synthase family protein [Tepidisphaeraceae bacterium]
MIISLTPERLASSVLAVPPLCRNGDFTLNEAENAKLIRHIEAGGIRALLYGGNANFHHIATSEFDALLSMLARLAAEDTLVIPSVAPTFGTMMDQAKIIRRHTFPTVMVLPLVGSTTSRGVEAGIRKFVDAAGVPALLYIKNDGYVEVEEVARLSESRTISGIKYAVLRKNTADDPYLRKLCDHVDRSLIVSGIGEQPAVVHLRDFKLAGFTSGVVCVAPRIAHDMLKAMRGGDWPAAERLRAMCKPLEDLRNAINPVRVLHEAVRLAGIANTGPMLPLLSNLDEADHARVRDAAAALLRANDEASDAVQD